MTYLIIISQPNVYYMVVVLLSSGFLAGIGVGYLIGGRKK